jgi:hypothetical protein
MDRLTLAGVDTPDEPGDPDPRAGQAVGEHHVAGAEDCADGAWRTALTSASVPALARGRQGHGQPGNSLHADDCTVQGTLRELVIPFGRCRINPVAEQVRAPTIAWLSGHGLLTTAAAVEQYDAMHFERLAAMAYPACDRAALQLISNVMGWFFLFDDQFDGILGTDPNATAAAVDAMTRCLDYPPSGADRAGSLGVAFRELWLTSAAQMSPSWRRRTRTSWIRYLRSHTAEATARRDGDSDLAAYLATRQDSIGIPRRSISPNPCTKSNYPRARPAARRCPG